MSCRFRTQHWLTLREYLSSASTSTITILADTNVRQGVIYFCPLNTFTYNTSTNFLVPSALSGIHSFTAKLMSGQNADTMASFVWQSSVGERLHREIRSLGFYTFREFEKLLQTSLNYTTVNSVACLFHFNKILVSAD